MELIIIIGGHGGIQVVFLELRVLHLEWQAMICHVIMCYVLLIPSYSFLHAFCPFSHSISEVLDFETFNIIL